MGAEPLRVIFDKITDGIWGGFLLLGFQKRGLDYLRFGKRDLLLSFSGMIWLLPLVYWQFLQHHSNTLSEITRPLQNLEFFFNSFIAVKLLIWLMAWLTFPVLIWLIALLLGYRANLVRFIITMNWMFAAVWLSTNAIDLAQQIMLPTNELAINIALYSINGVNAFSLGVTAWLLMTVLKAGWLGSLVSLSLFVVSNLFIQIFESSLIGAFVKLTA